MKKSLITTTFCLTLITFSSFIKAAPVLIDFDDVIGSRIDITNRYAGLGVTLNAIDNPFPLSGAFPAPDILPVTLGGVSTWTEGFASALSPPQVAVSSPFAGEPDYGDGGILISFAFDVNSVSLVGVDNGTNSGTDDESVTLTAYDASGNKIDQVYSTTNLPSALGYDQTSVSIALPGIRYVAFNHTDSNFGFYSIDNLEFVAAPIPEPNMIFLLSAGLIALVGFRRKFGRIYA
ncbi:MAG: PEP-CTERM sorting domain-containing protein [Nitrosomonas sp.]|nr:PEP-CTERM sorting domain-containing protein [Nitrosomonas sp.]